MKSTFVILLMCVLLGHSLFGQSDFLNATAKSIKTEYAPKPKDFKTKKISAFVQPDACVADPVEYGSWFKFFPKTDKLKVIVSTGFNWGTLSDPVLFIGVMDTVDGEVKMITLGCEANAGDQGDFVLEVLTLRPNKKHYLLVGASGKKEKYGLYLTEKFTPSAPEAPVDSAESQGLAGGNEDGRDEESAEPEERAKPDDLQGNGIIMGRIRKEGGRAVKDFAVTLLNDDLQEITTVQTDDSGVFRIDAVDASRINLLRMGEDGEHLVIDMFFYNAEGNIIAKPVALGHHMYSFKAGTDVFSALNVLTEKDLVVMVKQGKSSMTGKVVDRATYLIGKEGVRIGLYSPRKTLLRNAITDQNGMFVFTQLDEREYIVKVDHSPDEDYVEIVLTDDHNVPYAISNSSDQHDDGYFRFRKLPEDEVKIEKMEVTDLSGFHHHYYTMLSEEEPGVAYEIHSIEFEVGSSNLQSGRNDELDQLARELNESPAIRIKIDGHTDDLGVARQNMKLSLVRAESVKAYLVERGVQADRIECQGYGSEHPIAPNDNEQGRSLNRRVEFSIIENTP